MASAAIEQPARTTSPLSKIVLAAALVLLIALNAAYALFLRPRGTSIEATSTLADIGVLQAVALQGQTIALVTTDNRLVLAEGATVIAQKQLGGVVNKLAASADLARIVGGSTDRKVLLWNKDLSEAGSFDVNGRVTGLYVKPDGNILVSSSVGLFTGRSSIGLFDATGKPISSKRVGIDVTGLRADATSMYYTDVQGNIIALAQSDWKERWRKKLTQPATELELTTKGQLLTGDERGNVALFNPDGAQVWAKTLSEYKIRMAHDDPASGLILVGDSDGSLFALRSETGEQIFKAALPETGGAARSFLSATDQSLTLMTERGSSVAVNLSAALGAQRQGLIDAIYLGGNVLLGLLAVGALVAAVPALRAPALRTGKRIKQSRTAYLLILPAMLMIAVFSYYPTVMGLYFSFTNFNLSEPIKFNGLENFQRLARDRFFWTGVGNMVLLLITGMIKAMTLPLLVAELVFWLRSSKLRYLMRTAFIIPSIVPGVVGVLLWKQIYQPNYGLLNEFLGIIGLPQLQRAWLGDEQTAIWAIIFAGFPWVGTFGFLILFGGLLNINRELFDAAEMDGANAWSRFINVDLPLLRPQMRLLLFFAFLGGAQEYGSIWILTRGGPGIATYVPGVLTLTPSFILANQLSMRNSLEGLIVFYVAGGQVFAIFLLRAFFQSQPEEIFEAARMDGATEWRMIWSIAVPLATPILITLAILNFLSIYNDFLWPLLMLPSTDLHTLTIALQAFNPPNERLPGRPELGIITAAYVFASLPILAVFTFGMKYYIEGLTSGAIKS